MKKKMIDQYIYMIGNQDIGEKEILFPLGTSCYHLDYYRSLLEAYPELVYQYNLIIDRNLSEQFAKHGMIIYENGGKIDEHSRHLYENLEYTGYLYIPKNPTDIQKSILLDRMDELEKIFLELAICDNDNVEYVIKENNQYTAYQKLKSIVHK